MFPQPSPYEQRRCARCGHWVRADRMISGRYGSDCAEQLGLLGDTIDVGQDGPDLFDAWAEEDACDGWDQPADGRKPAQNAADGSEVPNECRCERRRLS